MRKQKYTEQERKRHYYFFDYLFWLGEVTWRIITRSISNNHEGVICCGPV